MAQTIDTDRVPPEVPSLALPSSVHAQPIAIHAVDGQTDQIVGAIPTPILRLLVLFGRPIRWSKHLLQILCWKSSSPVDSWLLLGTWWAVCLGGAALWKLFLPIILLLPFLPLPTTPSLRPPSINLGSPLLHSQEDPVTPQTVLLTLSHLHDINSMLPSTILTSKQREWLESWRSLGSKRLVRGGLTSWAAWASINYLLGGRSTFALLGSALILAHSPYIKTMYALLSKSLLLRRFATLLFLCIFGSPPTSDSVDIAGEAESPSVRTWLRRKWVTSRRPSFAFRLRPDPSPTLLAGSAIEDEHAEDPIAERPSNGSTSPALYFLFELQENQRWWMGLDWTSALLPQERPSWCDAYLHPSTPPTGFTLPSESVMYLPEPRKDDPNGRSKRVSHWRWLDEDWSAVKKIGGGQSLSQPIPTAVGPINHHNHTRSSSMSFADHQLASSSALNAEEPKKGIAEQAFVKGLERLKARTMASNATPSVTPSPNSKRPLSGEFSDNHDSFNHDNLGRRISTEDTRRKSSAGSDLVSLLQHAGTGLGPSNMANPTAAIGSGNTLNVPADLNVGTDLDGWSYGDNKWENMGPKGGMGRYTRRRRWQRRAVCTETVEYISGNMQSSTSAQAECQHEKKDGLVLQTVMAEGRSPGYNPLSESKDSEVTGYSVSLGSTLPLPPTAPAVTVPTTVLTGTASKDGHRSSSVRRDSSLEERDQALRQRLKHVMANVGS